MSGSRDLLVRSPAECTVPQCGRRVRIGVHSIWKATTVAFLPPSRSVRPSRQSASSASCSLTGDQGSWRMKRRCVSAQLSSPA